VVLLLAASRRNRHRICNTGRRIGQHLIDLYCEDLDRTGQAGYLEANRPGNVSFYRRFGVETIVKVSVIGVRNEVIWRESRLNSGNPRLAADRPLARLAVSFIL
jgi:hypothetical protein